jgi:DNA modification methylase
MVQSNLGTERHTPNRKRAGEKNRSVKGDTVLDPFLGSGTTAKIAMQNERNSIGYETDPELLPIISKRISDCKQASELQIIKR